jgi:phosphinothricin acetyltransferase
VEVRGVELGDAEAVARIYAPIVGETHISFEVDPPDVIEMGRRIGKAIGTHPWLVATEDRSVVGYAYATEHSDRSAYRWAVDTSIYLADHVRGRGFGSVLYEQLLDELRILGYVSAFAGIALPNDPSVALHRRVGFTAVGSFPVAGHKLGRWIDVSLWRCALAVPAAEPLPPATWTGPRSTA